MDYYENNHVSEEYPLNTIVPEGHDLIDLMFRLHGINHLHSKNDNDNQDMDITRQDGSISIPVVNQNILFDNS